MVFSVLAVAQGLGDHFGSAGAHLSPVALPPQAESQVLPWGDRGDFSLKCLGPLPQITFTSGDVGHRWPLSQSIGEFISYISEPRAKGSATLAHKVSRSFITELYI